MKKKINLSLSSAFLISLLAISPVNAEENKENVVKDKATKEKLAKEEKEREENRPPIGCRETGYSFDLQALHLLPDMNGANQSMYLLHNQLGSSLSLYHMRADESSRSLFLNHVIGPHEWGILSTGEKVVKFICSVPDKKSPFGRVVDCEQALKVCEYTNVRYGLNNRGNFWLYNVSTRNSAVSAIVHYGIIPGD